MHLVRLAPAKINLYLRVLGRRLDGYHEIDTLLVPLELADTVELELALDQPTAVSCRCPDRPDLDGPDNLAARAARLYLAAAGREASVELRLHKRIFVAAGLGGGSSDAASVLLLLDQVLGPLPRPRLTNLAVTLGADVPFFLGTGAARARGRGERLEPLAPSGRLHLVLANPGTAIPTSVVYGGLGLRPGEGTGRLAVDDARIARLPAGLAELVENDLTPVAERLCPTVARLREQLIAAGARAACMTGSGPTVFGLFDSPRLARAAARELSNMSGIFVQETVTASA